MISDRMIMFLLLERQMLLQEDRDQLIYMVVNDLYLFLQSTARNFTS